MQKREERHYRFSRNLFQTRECYFVDQTNLGFTSATGSSAQKDLKLIPFLFKCRPPPAHVYYEVKGGINPKGLRSCSTSLYYRLRYSLFLKLCRLLSLVSNGLLWQLENFCLTFQLVKWGRRSEGTQ